MRINIKRQKALSWLMGASLVLGLAAPGAAKMHAEASGPLRISESYGLSAPSTGSDGTETWDCVWFGRYWQGDTNGDGKADKNDEKQPIKWRVLSVDGDDAFLLADQNLDMGKYNEAYKKEMAWEFCTMRSWLNGLGPSSNLEGKDYQDNSFLEDAFTGWEQPAIRTTKVVNEGNPETEAEGGSDTNDKIYLLSIAEVQNPAYGFANNGYETKTREAANTAYVADSGKTDSIFPIPSAGKNDRWWLRSPGDNLQCASVVASDGYVLYSGSYVMASGIAVRPALHLDLSSVQWCLAGTVSSAGEVNEIPPEKRPIPTPTPEPSLAPEESAEPEETAEPEASSMPEGSAMPGESRAPEASHAPESEKSTAPEGSSAPEASSEPEASLAPEETAEPEASPAPEGSAMPGESRAPEASHAPEPEASTAPGQSPQVSGSPIPPGNTAVPVPSHPAENKPSQAPFVPGAAETPVPEPTNLTPMLTPGGGEMGAEAQTANGKPGRVKGFAVKKKGRSARMSWKKAAGVSGYQIRFGTSRKFKKKNHVLKYKRVKKNKAVVKGLKRKRTYYFCARAYRLESGKKIWGRWSKVRKLRV